MRRLDTFAGFSIRASGQSQVQSPGGTFNPFGPELQERTQEVVKVYGTAKPMEQLLQNILDSPQPDTSSDTNTNAEPLALFPQAKPKAEPLQEVEHEIVPMIQPRDKEGKRLLYRHPKLPRVGVKGSFSLLVGHSDKSATAWLMQFDGAANPNPGPASSGAVLWSPVGLDGQRSVVYEVGKFLGRATNNIAEAQGLLLGLKMAALRGARELLIEGDSELIIKQHLGQYKVSDRNLKQWWAETQAAMMDETCFDWIAIRHVYREQNERADSITKEVLSKKEGFQRS
jgi:ribonuclease HI